MEINLYNQKAESIGKIDLPDQIFGLKMNADLLHQVVTSQMSNKRQVLAHAKGRSEVRGGGKKPWRQKGTGRARHGSIRSPIWKGGGATFGPTKERNFKKKLNRKMVRKALFVALSSKARDNQLLVVDGINIQNPKTKEMAVLFKNFLDMFGKNPNVLLVMPTGDDNVKRASKNLPHLSAVEAKGLNLLEVLAHKQLLLVKDSIGVLEKKLKV
ncbi:MAG: 50S ribosomal protein L4 [Candidatus Yanofskybacteria bacterium]|nr:50S ribosomal protein L4 [Candidatus Yanofskybacteria bacterium]